MLSHTQFKAAAKEMGIPIAELGRRLGVSLATTRRYGNGKNRIPDYIDRSVRAHLICFRAGMLDEIENTSPVKPAPKKK
jgi:hypothetical protein